MKVRAMEFGDMDAAAEIEAVTFREPWGKDVFYRQLLNPGRRRLLVAEKGGIVIGHLAAWLRARTVNITTLAVKPEARRQGVATALVKKLIVEQSGLREKIKLEVRISNKPARTLYRKLGFEEQRKKKNYYVDNGETALVMSCPIPRQEVAAAADPGRTPEAVK